MFEKKRLTFYYCISPVHMGAGNAVGAIDNPIQREVYTNHPVFNGAGIKGAIRHHVNGLYNGQHAQLISELFGPDSSGENLHAGALSFTDAQLVLFPVRSLKKTFVYITSPYALARLERLCKAADLSAGWTIPQVQSAEQALTASTEPAINSSYLILESFKLNLKKDENVNNIANWLKNKLGNDLGEFFLNKISSDLVVVADEVFNFFVQNSTIVEPHVRIDDETGTAADKALFYTECLPPESLLAGLTLASIERTNKADKKNAEKILKILFDKTPGEPVEFGINNAIVQMGGDATTGRGFVRIHSVVAQGENKL